MEKLVLVHSGNIFPDHLNHCIELSMRQNLEVDLLIDPKLRKFVKHEINIESIDDYSDELYLNYSNKSFDNNFMDGFWNRTSSRFFVISNYAASKNLKSFFHIENDIVLFSDLAKCARVLNRTNKDIALVMDSLDRCIPSIMWFKDQEILKNLSQHIFHNDHLNDMQSLAVFFKKNKDKALNLPILPLQKKISDIDFGNMLEEFGCIFDGAAIGQYLFGIHTPLNPSSNTQGFINETAIFNSSTLNYFFANGAPFVELSDKKIPIVNLHIHSKNLKQFI